MISTRYASGGYEVIGYSIHPGERRRDCLSRVELVMLKSGFIKEDYSEIPFDKEDMEKGEAWRGKRRPESIGPDHVSPIDFSDDEDGEDPLLRVTTEYSFGQNNDSMAIHEYIHPRVETDFKITPGGLWVPDRFDSRRSKKGLDGIITLRWIPIKIRKQLIKDLGMTLKQVGSMESIIRVRNPKEDSRARKD
jgi:hypothetical protein